MTTESEKNIQTIEPQQQKRKRGRPRSIPRTRKDFRSDGRSLEIKTARMTILHYLGVPQEVIARELGVQTPAVNKRINKALAKLNLPESMVTSVIRIWQLSELALEKMEHLMRLDPHKGRNAEIVRRTCMDVLEKSVGFVQQVRLAQEQGKGKPSGSQPDDESITDAVDRLRKLRDRIDRAIPTDGIVVEEVGRDAVGQNLGGACREERQEENASETSAPGPETKMIEAPGTPPDTEREDEKKEVTSPSPAIFSEIPQKDGGGG